ncbi:MAG: hypothetical protein RIS64_2774 [Bacteroidota bacterium]|jgi:NADH-quinone oxidoreductase subunit M
MITVLLIFFPLLAALLLLLMQGTTAKRMALGFSLAEWAIWFYSYIAFKNNPINAALSMKKAWISSIGANFAVSTDGISILMTFLTALLVPFIILSSFKGKYSSSFYALILLMQTALMGVFTATDGLLFYIFWELALIPIWFICLIWGGEHRGRITFKFFVYTLAGSLIMLLGLLYLYFQTNGTMGRSFEWSELVQAGKMLSETEQNYVFWAIFLAFAIKMPIFPFHTWQPDTYVVAPTPGTMLLSGIMLKMGTYGLLRWLMPLVPAGVAACGKTAMILSIIGIIYASCIAIVQKDFKRLIAYSSIAHVGLISAGIFAWNVEGVTGALMQMIAHGINVVGLFFIAEIIFNRTNTRQINELGGLRHVAPQFALLFLIILLGSVALPMTNGFVGEFLLLNGIFKYNIWLASAAGLTVILGAVYMLRSYQGLMLGETNKRTQEVVDLDLNEKMILVGISILIILMGVYPKPFLEISQPAIQTLLETVKQ